MTGIFISYRREHTAVIVGRLHDHLAAHFGPDRIVRDVAVDVGDDFDARIDEVVGSSAAFLAIISSRWLVDRNPVGKRPIGVPRDWVQREVEVALRRPDLLVIPVLIEGAALPADQQLPYSIRSLARCNTMPLSDLDWDNDVRKLTEVLEEAVKPQGTAPTPAALPAGTRTPPAPAASAPAPDTPPPRRRFRRRSAPS